MEPPRSEAEIAGWRSDLTFVADSLPLAHANFFHAVTRARYREALDSLSARVPRLPDYAIVTELARIVAMVGEGHTRLTVPFDSTAGFFSGHTRTPPPRLPLQFHHLPIRFGWFADTLWVTRTDAAHRALLGGRVVRIGRRAVAAAIAAVTPVEARDNDADLASGLPAALVCPEFLAARGVVADPESPVVVVASVGGRDVTASFAPVPVGRLVAWVSARAPGLVPLAELHPERRHWFTVVPGSRAVYARYREVYDDPDQTVAQFANGVFATAARESLDRVVLDVRANEGGNGALNRALLQQAIRAVRCWGPAGLWVVVDRGTFSAATMCAADFESWTPAVLVGEKTGGHPNTYGDPKRLTLPYSGLTVRVSSLFWQLTSPQDHRDGITPHLPVTTMFHDWQTGRDLPLEAALAGAPRAFDAGGVWRGVLGWRNERFDFALTLHRRGDGWTGQVDFPRAELHATPLDSVRVSSTGVTGFWLDGGETWRVAARAVGSRLVGVVDDDGLTHPFVLERGP